MVLLGWCCWDGESKVHESHEGSHLVTIKARSADSNTLSSSIIWRAAPGEDENYVYAIALL
jgi:hypothetical protein